VRRCDRYPVQPVAARFAPNTPEDDVPIGIVDKGFFNCNSIACTVYPANPECAGNDFVHMCHGDGIADHDSIGHRPDNTGNKPAPTQGCDRRINLSERSIVHRLHLFVIDGFFIVVHELVIIGKVDARAAFVGH
jgi:hypothetical protein